ncbi:MAG: NAD(P)H-dependent oxidoreductase subunit E [Saprospiraceae bacterium]|nr:NAD(P)H-dependent oxidoreductase subunit E [Saprospiraceae bacterium]MBK8370468.1 NAD(P)H-dependent oxidoreductase subunit E [Saprospiraceae bacterium]MBK9044360.1 NAD(P)H-dependent oxidoreductase subunit E [Saprospiraceae bacterium]
MSKNLSHLSGRKGLQENLFEELGILSKASGTVSNEEIEKLKNKFLFGEANLYGTVTFYDFLKPENQGKKVYICNGTACLCADTQLQLKEKLLKHFSENEIGEMCCLGRCHENNAFYYQGQNYSGESAENQIQQLNAHKTSSGMDTYHVGTSGSPILTQSDETEKYIIHSLSLWLKKPKDQLLEELKISGLRGRGGAGFPIGFKLESCKNVPSDIRFIVCNADEGDPGAFSDRYIMEQKPFSLLLGMMAAGYVAEAGWGVLYIRAEYPESVQKISESVQKLRELGLLGDNILGTTFSFDFKIIKAQGAYICGEETALLSSIEGQRPEVRVRPPYPTQYGLFQKPTVVNNVETLANIPFVLNNGGKSFASLGRGKSTGTKLLSLDSFFNRPGIYEVDMGTSLQEVIYNLGLGFKKPVKAIHIGGPLGGVVPISKINNLTIDFESFQENGFLLGHASFVCIPETFPMISYIRHLFAFTAHESCGKCFPCRLGSTRGYEMIDKALDSDYKIDSNLLQDLLETLELGSLCALGGGLPLPIKNILQYFEPEMRTYFRQS